MGDKLDDRHQIIGSVVPVLGFNAQTGGIQLVSLQSVIIYIKDYARTETKCQRTHRSRTGNRSFTDVEFRSIVHLDALELTTVGVQRSMSVEPQGTVRQFAIKIERTIPDVCLARVSVLSGRQCQDTLTLLHQTHTSRKRCTIDGSCIIIVLDVVVVRASLHP